MKDTQRWTGKKVAVIAFNCFLSLAIVVSSMMIVIDKSRIKNGVEYTGKTDAPTQAVDSNAVTKGSSGARLMFAGDNLIHRGIYRQANERADGSGYDFSYAYNGIKDIISKSDIAFLNQETVMDSDNEPSSYPLFNSPTQLLDEMISVGFDVFNQATNHVMDMELSGALNDIKLFKSKNDIMLTGLYETREDMLKAHTKEVNGVTFSFVGFTEYLNGLTVPTDSDLGLIYLTDDRYSEQELNGLMKQMIENAKKASDVVCVSMHWQDEDITQPDESQKEIVDKLLSYGADIIIGTGPHVLQPMEFKKNADGENALVMWSLGNFISCQDSVDNLLGGIADVTVTKNQDTGETVISSAKLIPTITQYSSEYEDVHIVPLADYTDSLVSSHGINDSTSSYTMSYINDFYSNMFGDKLEIKYK